MISEKQLLEWQSQLYKKPIDPQIVEILIAEIRMLNKEAINPQIVEIMIAEIRMLNKEANWLANGYARMSRCTKNVRCEYWTNFEIPESFEECQKCWREAARKEIQND